MFAPGKAQQASLALLQSNAMQPSLFAKPVESITMPEAGPDFCVRGARQKGLHGIGTMSSDVRGRQGDVPGLAGLIRAED